MDYRSELICLAEAMSAATGRSEARIANLARRDGRFFVRLREGSTCSVDTLHTLRQWFSDNWPEGSPWPAGIQRPVPATAPHRPTPAAASA